MSTKKALIASVPHSGTHFTVWLLKQWGFDVRFMHFLRERENQVTEILSNLDPSFPVVIPYRHISSVKESWRRRGNDLSQLEIAFYIEGHGAKMHTNEAFFVDAGTVDKRVDILQRLNHYLKAGQTKEELIQMAERWPRITGGDVPDMHALAVKDWRRLKEWTETEDKMDDKHHGIPLRSFTINEWTHYCHSSSKQGEWWDGVDPSDIGVACTKIALIHSEVSEMLEGFRKGLMDDHLPDRPMEEVEAADIAIRLFDYCGARGLDLEGAIVEKIKYNQQRADHKPENRAKEGGKKF